MCYFHSFYEYVSFIFIFKCSKLRNRYSLVADHPQWNVLKGDMMGLTTKQKEYDADIDDLLKCLGSHFVVNVNDGPIL